MAAVSKRFLASLLGEGDHATYLGFGDLAPMFSLDATYRPAQEFVDKYVRMTGKLPSMELVAKETGLVFEAEEAAPEFLFEKMKELHVERKVKLIAQDTKTALSTSPAQAMQTMAEGIRHLEAELQGSQIADFKHAASVLLPMLYSKWAGDVDAVPFGWPTMDDMTGGLQPGDFVSLVGRPGKGKTWLTLYIALHVWQALKKPIVFFSMEMNRQIIMTRLAAMFTHVSPNFLKDGLDATLFGGGLKEKLVDGLTALESSDMPPFIIVDAKMTGTVADVEAVTRMVQPAAVFVDGAYLLSHPKARNAYDAVAQNVPLLKGDIAERIGLPLVTSWQFSREAEKMKKDEQPGLKHIGYSDTIGQTSSIVLGLFEDDNFDNVENIAMRKVHILKGRSGEAGEFLTRWDFDGVDFSEYNPEDEVEFFDL